MADWLEVKKMQIPYTRDLHRCKPAAGRLASKGAAAFDA